MGHQRGVPIGQTVELRSGTKNMKSAGEQPQVVQAYLDKKIACVRVWDIGSVEEEIAMEVQCSLFGVIPKKNKPGKWRLIFNLSAPEGASVNDGIPKELCTLGYLSVDDLGAETLKRGKGSEMAKITCGTHTGMYQCTRGTGTYWEWNGRAGCS